MMYTNQIIMLYLLNLHSAVCQLYLKTGRKKKFTLPDLLQCYTFVIVFSQIFN